MGNRKPQSVLYEEESVLSTLTELLSPDYANQTAIVIPDGGPRLTYAESRAQVASLSETLKRGGIRA
ncbi:hypothetical protein HYR99_05640, partial [Candidatus Poribacteria bacterium]|nr:hypothetical protein [Candidatus Poribacteria bacterium]